MKNFMSTVSTEIVLSVCIIVLLVGIMIDNMLVRTVEVSSEIKVLETGESYDQVMFKGHTYYRFKETGDMEHDPTCEVCKDFRAAEMQEVLDGMYN